MLNFVSYFYVFTEMTINKYIFYLIISILIFPCNMLAQADSTYIQKFDLPFSARIFTTQKMSFFTIENEASKNKRTEIRTNSPTSIGLGISLRDYSISFSQGISPLRDKTKGKTKAIDFEYHGYKSTYIYDLFLQYHKGFYRTIENKDNDIITLHPDISMYLFGGNWYYVFNNKHFSYRAIFNQNELQKKSSGSLLAGVSGYYSIVNSDSTFISEQLSQQHKNLQFGLSLGYAYTWVINRKWQISGSVNTGANIGNNHPTSFFKHKMEIYPTINFRSGFLYSRDEYSISLTVLLNTHYLYYAEKENLGVNNMQIRLGFVKRFNWKNPFVNKTIDKLNNTKSKFRL